MSFPTVLLLSFLQLLVLLKYFLLQNINFIREKYRTNLLPIHHEIQKVSVVCVLTNKELPTHPYIKGVHQ